MSGFANPMSCGALAPAKRCSEVVNCCSVSQKRRLRRKKQWFYTGFRSSQGTPGLSVSPDSLYATDSKVTVAEFSAQQIGMPVGVQLQSVNSFAALSWSDPEVGKMLNAISTCSSEARSKSDTERSLQNHRRLRCSGSQNTERHATHPLDYFEVDDLLALSETCRNTRDHELFTSYFARWFP